MTSLGVVPAVASEESAIDAGSAKSASKQTYIVQLDKAAVPARTAQGRSRTKPSASAWRATLKSDQTTVRAAMKSRLGTSPTVGRTWTEALNGFSVTLTDAQATAVEALPGVRSVSADRMLSVDSTSNGADWIKADSVWTGNGTSGVEAKGDGIVVGVIDTGINPSNPSFAASVSVANGGDGYVVTNPRGTGNYLGMCDPANTAQYAAGFACTDKLIGAYNFTGNTPSSDLYDDTGHGSHTASTAAGNQVRTTWPGTDILPTSGTTTDPNSGLTTVISGVAPHANLVSYDVCINADGCSTAAIVSAYNQAINDGVDVLNFSIGSATIADPWTNLVAQAQLSARQAGISVAGSAGNSGSDDSSISTYGGVAWVTSVANTSHDLGVGAGTVTFTTSSGGAASVGPFATATVSASLSTPTSVVYAADVDTVTSGTTNDGRCIPGSLPTANVTGKIVVCTRGGTVNGASQSRVATGRVVATAGGAGMILVNPVPASGTPEGTLPHDIHVLPAAHLNSSQATALRTAFLANSGMKAIIAGGTLTSDSSRADIVNASSSRGPTRNGTRGIGPSLAAPGTDVLAAGGTGNASVSQVMTGTSMAAPHVAGSMALLKQLHPTWTDAEIQSALMTTSTTAVKDYDGTDATWFEMGSGRIDVAKAANAGLLLDAPTAAYSAANPALGGDLRTVNSSQLTDASCPSTCTLARTFTSTAQGIGRWTAAVSTTDAALSLTLNASSFDISTAGQTQALTVTATVSSTSADTWHTGTLTLTPPSGSSAAPVHLPIAVAAVSPTLSTALTRVQRATSVVTQRDSGTHGLGWAITASSTATTYTVSAPTAAEAATANVTQDATPDNPWNASSGALRSVTVPAGVKRLVVEIGESTAPDVDLYVGTGTTPSAATLVCASRSSGSAEICGLNDPAAGSWWVLVQNYTSSAAGVDAVTSLVAGITDTGVAEHLRVTPTLPLAKAGAGQPLTLTWDAPFAAVGSAAYVAVSATSPGSATTTAYVRIEQAADDVTVASLPTTASPGGVVSPSVVVRPDQTGESPRHDVAVTLPVGWSVEGGSITAGGTATTVDDVVTVRWSGTAAALAAAAGLTPDQAVTLGFNATVGALIPEGEKARVTTTESITVAGGGASTTDAHDITMSGGAYATATTVGVTDSVITASVAGIALAKPTGTVTFGVDGVNRAPMDLTNGAATLSLDDLGAGEHTVVATYAGDATNRASTSSTATVRVKSSSAVALTLSKPSVTTAQRAVATATIGHASSTLASAAATGTVTFLVDGKVVGSALLSGATATYTLPVLAAGTHAVTARYAGDSWNLPVTSAAALLKVTVAPVVRKAVTITAKTQGTVRKAKKAKPLVIRLTAVGAKPRGRVTVTIKGAGRTITTKVAVPASGVINVALGKFKKAGKVRVTVSYAGDTTSLAKVYSMTFTVKKK